MKNLYILIILIFFQVNINAQNPGYYGKKFNVGYNVASGLVPGDDILEFRDLILSNMQHQLDLSYTLSHNMTLGLSFNTLTTGNKTFITYSEGGFDGFEYYRKTKKVKSKGLNLVFRKYKNGIAPIGKYWGLFAGITANEYIFYKKRSGEKLSTTAFNSTILGVEFGRNRLITDRIYLKTGVSFGYTFKDPDDPRTIRVFNFYRMMVGIGYIPF